VKRPGDQDPVLDRIKRMPDDEIARSRTYGVFLSAMP
jgi:hypothetical protein